MKRMTKSQALAYMRGWRAVNRIERDESRGESDSARLRNFQFMLDAGQSWPWTKEQLAVRERDAKGTRERWRKLRVALGG